MSDEQQKMIAKNDYDISHVIYTDQPRKLQAKSEEMMLISIK